MTDKLSPDLTCSPLTREGVWGNSPIVLAEGLAGLACQAVPPPFVRPICHLGKASGYILFDILSLSHPQGPRVSLYNC